MVKRKGLRLGILAAAAVMFLGMQTTMTVQAGKTEVNLAALRSDYKIKETGNVHYFFGTSNKQSIIVDCDGSVEIHLQGVKIDDDDKAGIRIEKGSHVTLYVEDYNYLYGGDSHAGLQVDEGASVTILGNGELEAIGSGKKSHGAAGIGSAYNESCGKIIIGNSRNSPTITAKSGDGGAGIGSGEDGRCDDGIYIYNGNITATGTNGGAGIGGGDAVGAGSGGKTSTIEISGGTVKATGGSGAAGIGGSDTGSSGSGGDVSNITISGGTVTATGGSEGAGIGGSKDCYAENITISGGNITAKGGKYAAGIGGGNAIGAGDGGDITNLTITGGTIKATGGESAAGIGGGDQSEVKNLKIEEASSGSLNITAQGGKWGAGIGNGNSGVVSKNIDSIYIKLNGGTITATGGSQGAGIGGGNSTAKKIEIYGSGTINATGYDESCGIGAGECEEGGTIIIEGTAGSRSLVINAEAAKSTGKDNDAAAIGAADSVGGDITIKNAEVYIWNVNDCLAAGIGSAKNSDLVPGGMGNITIENCYIKDRSYTTRNAVSIGAGHSSSVDNITIKNSEVHGGAIGSSSNKNQAIEPTIDCITIEGSTIEADRSNGQGAAIGAGKYDGIKKIVIKNSNITAKTVSGAAIGSGGYEEGDWLRWTGGECGDVFITNSTVTATGGDGGAGIGGGWGTPAGHIMISGSTITATGGNRGKNTPQGGAGIGGGHGESLEYISIKDNSTITATGGGQAAGIGSGGYDSVYTTIWNTSCGYIYMENSKVTATGGSRAAGIGTGNGAQFTEAGNICIVNCEVAAQGGEYGAGIGAGADAAAGSGGEAHDIVISGKSKVTATGGKRGAGIGGGCDGGCEEVRISLNDTKYSNGDWVYYVRATGGSGAAGIGSGGVVAEDETFTQNGHDIDKVTIEGGYVYAQGGADDYGAGAGIGGGARGGNLNGFYVTGGYVEAHAGYAESNSKAQADDIGTGGDDGRPVAEDENFEITGGTVIGSLSSDPDEIIIDGGSVSHICVGEDDEPNAERSNGTKVYRTLLRVEEPYYELRNLKTSLSGYGTNDVISDGGGYVYLYLPQSDTNRSTADFKVNGASKHYYGTTNKSGNSWLKMELVTSFKEPTGDNTPIAGGEFVMELNDSTLTGETTFIVSGNAELRSEESVQSPEATATLYGIDFGEFTIQAANAGNDMYWSATAEYIGKITKKAGTLKITEDPTKVYDGIEVEDPEVETSSDGTVTYTYYEGSEASGTALDSAPVNAGTYTVVATVAGTDKYTEASASQIFTIDKRPIVIGMTATENGGNATVSVEVFGAVNNPGQIEISVNDGSYQTVDVLEIDGKYIAQKEFQDVAGDTTYKVTARYVDTANYVCKEPVEGTFTKNMQTRTIEAEDIEVTYGDSPVIIEPSVSTGSANSENDIYSYEVSYQSFEAYGLKDTITVDQNNGTVTVENAGIAIVKVTLTDKSAAYADAVTYVTVTVRRKPISVTSYAYQKDDANKTPVNTAVYGQIDTLEYGLMYGGSTSEPENFAIGTLKAVPLNKTSGVGSDARIAIAKEGAPVTINGKTYNNVFVSRNYNITYNPTAIQITPAPLTIKANSVASEYGIAPEYTYMIGDSEGNNHLMPWDSVDDVIESVGLAAGQSYTELTPGTYEDAIAVTVKQNPNYTITPEAADLIIGKGSVDLYAEIESKVYDGMANDAEAAAEPVTSEGITAAMLEEPADVDITYFKIGKEDEPAELATAPIEPGYYLVKVVVPENDYYEEAEIQKYFRIDKASLLVEVSPEIKSYDGEPVETTVSSAPVISYDTTADQMKAPGEAVLIYYEVGEDGSLTELTSAPVNAGSYLVRAEVAESDCYEAAGGENYFRIYKARYEIDAPEVPDMLMRDGLTLADQKLPDGWAWVKPSTELSAGEVSAYAVHTPEDTENYFPAIRKVTFTVYKENSDGDGINFGGDTSSDTSDNTSDDTSGDRTTSGNAAVDTGDNNQILLFIILLIVSGMAIVDVVVKKDN